MTNFARRLRPLLLMLGLGWTGCERVALPRKAEVIVFVDTDAPLSPATGGGFRDGPPLFDRLRIELYPPGESTPCAECTREFVVDVQRLRDRKASISVNPRAGTPGHRVRVRLFRSTNVIGSEPKGDAAIETVIALPVVADGELVSVTALLETSTLGHPNGSLDAPAAAIAGPPEVSRVDGWEGGKRVPCTSSDASKICIPGGAFWMGHPIIFPYIQDSPEPVQRLVVVSPFRVDRAELTVGEVRALFPIDDLEVFASWSGKRGSAPADFCTYAMSGENDALPMTCITWTGARAVCVRRGGTLPTEAQFEWMASGLGSGFYPWGTDEPACSDAVFERAPLGYPDESYRACRSIGQGPALPARSRNDRDRLVFSYGEVVDLAGNLHEWVRDGWDRQDGPCWGPGVFVDPYCVGARTHHGIRGGSFELPGSFLRAPVRIAEDDDIANPSTGVRCVYPVE